MPEQPPERIPPDPDNQDHPYKDPRIVLSRSMISAGKMHISSPAYSAYCDATWRAVDRQIRKANKLLHKWDRKRDQTEEILKYYA